MKVLVTGGAGFIGSHVVDSLRAAGHEPRIFDLVPSPHHPGEDIDTRLGDLLDPVDLAGAMRGCDAVAHLAAMADADIVARNPDEAERINARGTMRVLEAAADVGVRRVLYASTIWVYSDVEQTEVDEDTPLVLPSHVYTATKLAGEMYCRSFSELRDLDCRILRFGIPYGPRARGAAVVPTFVRKALAGEPLTLAGGGRQSRRFIYVKDLADGVARALDHGEAGRVYNLVGSEDVMIREVAHAVSDAIGDTSVVETPGRSSDFGGVTVSGERAARELGWEPRTEFADGVRHYVEWHRADALAPTPVPAPEVAPARSLPPRLLAFGRALRPAALMLLAVGTILGALLVMLDRAGVSGDDVNTVAIGSLLAVTLYLGLAGDADGGPGGLAGLGWLTAGAAVALVVSGPRDAMHLVHPGIALALALTLGAVVAVGTAAVSQRLLLSEDFERRSDTGG